MGEEAAASAKTELSPSTVASAWIERHVPNHLILLLALTYLFGYVITSIFYRSLGVQSVSFLKAQFIETGFIFIFIAVTLIAVLAAVPPLVALGRHRNNLSRSATVKIVLIIANLIITLMFYSIFATVHELRADVRLGPFSAEARNWLLSYLIVVITFLFASGGIERALQKDKIKKNFLTRTLPSSIRIVLLVISVLMDVMTYRCAPWLKDAILSSKFYLLVMVAFCITGSRILNTILWRRNDKLTEKEKAEREKEREEEKLAMESARWLHVPWGKAYYWLLWPSQQSQMRSSYRFWIVVGVYNLLLIYLLLTAYTYTVLRFLPESRGGAMPVVQSVLVIKGAGAEKLEDLLTPNVEGLGDSAARVTKPLYLIEQSGDDIYVTDHYEPFTDTRHPSSRVYRIRKDDVSAIAHEAVNLRSQ